MRKSIFCSIVTFALCALSCAQDSSYYKAIQKKSSDQIRPEQFKKMEQDALKNYTKPESYELLARSFGNTSEKVWAVIYGEVYCNLSPDSGNAGEISSLVYQWYDQSLSRKDNGLSVDLTENAQGPPNQPPFESQFEMSFLFAAAPLANQLPPLSIKGLAAIRQSQLSLWTQKKLPVTELVRRQQAILSAGHFEAYNYWLFKSARPDEFNQWAKEHQAQWQAWLDWQGKNKFEIKNPDFQRLSMLRGR